MARFVDGSSIPGFFVEPLRAVTETLSEYSILAGGNRKLSATFRSSLSDELSRPAPLLFVHTANGHHIFRTGIAEK